MRLPPRESVDHEPGRSQQWSDVDDDIRQWVGEIADIGGQLDDAGGVYLHGSLAMGGFYRPKSDVDLFVVTDSPLGAAQRSKLAVELLRLFDRRPIIGGIELSVVLRESIASFRHPAQYEFHFSEQLAEEVRRGGSGPRGTDRDLAAHCAVTRARGLALAGPVPSEVFGEVPRSAYLDAILDDLRWVLDGGVLESPFYGVLNICRCARVLLDDTGAPPSKDEGAQWALDHLPGQLHRVVADALACYRSAAPTPSEQRRHHGHAWDEQALLEIAGWAWSTLLSDT